MGIISIEKANDLFWLGRYSQRVYSTIKKYYNGFDGMLDGSTRMIRRIRTRLSAICTGRMTMRW